MPALAAPQHGQFCAEMAIGWLPRLQVTATMMLVALCVTRGSQDICPTLGCADSTKPKFVQKSERASYSVLLTFTHLWGFFFAGPFLRDSPYGQLNPEHYAEQASKPTYFFPRRAQTTSSARPSEKCQCQLDMKGWTRMLHIKMRMCN